MSINVAMLGPDARKQISEKTGPLTKPSKFHAEPQTDEDGTWHPSKRQQRRWHHLKLLERAGLIRNLRREVPYRLAVNGHLICKYFADHVYEEGALPPDGPWFQVVEDAKGVRTPEYKLKKKLMLAIHNISIYEV